MVRRSTLRILSRLGYRLAEASDGEDALLTWKTTGPFDLVLTDIVMPGMGGPEFALRLREECSTVPVLYMSGYNGELSTRFEFLTDRTRFLQKPFTAIALAKAVREILDESLE